MLRDKDIVMHKWVDMQCVFASSTCGGEVGVWGTPFQRRKEALEGGSSRGSSARIGAQRSTGSAQEGGSSTNFGRSCVQ